MNLKAVSALYRLPAETKISDLSEAQLVALNEWTFQMAQQSHSPSYRHCLGTSSMLLTDWMDREVEAASKGYLNPQN